MVMPRDCEHRLCYAQIGKLILIVSLLHVVLLVQHKIRSLQCLGVGQRLLCVTPVTHYCHTVTALKPLTQWIAWPIACLILENGLECEI
jgi:hypothetical protein